MWFKIKLSRNIVDEKGRDKKIQETYLTESDNFAEAGYKVVQIVGTDAEVEDVCMMKNYKPSVNDKFGAENEIFTSVLSVPNSDDAGLIQAIKPRRLCSLNGSKGRLLSEEVSNGSVMNLL